jgi:hypothetical protein
VREKNNAAPQELGHQISTRPCNQLIFILRHSHKEADPWEPSLGICAGRRPRIDWRDTFLASPFCFTELLNNA